MSKTVNLGVVSSDEYNLIVQSAIKMQSDMPYAKVSYKTLMLTFCDMYLNGNLKVSITKEQR